MNLPYPEQMEVIDLTKARLAKMRLYIAPARPCNTNRDVYGKDGEASRHLANTVGCSWQIRRASLLMAANRPRIDRDIQRRN